MDELEKEKFKIIEKRLDKAEKEIDNLKNIYITIKELTCEMKAIKEDTNSINERLSQVEKEPAENWKNISSYIVTTIIGLIIGFIFVKLGLK